MSLLSTSEGGREEQRRKLAEGGKMPARAQRIRSGQGDRYSSAVCLLAQISGSKLAAKPEGITAQTHLQHYTARGLASQSGGGGSRKGEMEGGAGENKYAVIILKSSTLDIHCKYMCTAFPAPSSLAASIRRGHRRRAQVSSSQDSLLLQAGRVVSTRIIASALDGIQKKTRRAMRGDRGALPPPGGRPRARHGPLADVPLQLSAGLSRYPMGGHGCAGHAR